MSMMNVMCETFNAVNKKFEEEDAASEDVDIIGNSVLLLLIHMKTLRIVWGSDEAVREEQKPTIAGLAVDGCGDAQTSQKRRNAKPASVSPPKQGCERCIRCGEKFERYDAEEYA